MPNPGPVVVSRLNFLDGSGVFELEFDLLDVSEVSLALCDASGVEQQVLMLQKICRKGTHNVELPKLDFARDIFYYRLVVQTPIAKVTDTKRIWIQTPA